MEDFISLNKSVENYLDYGIPLSDNEISLCRENLPEKFNFSDIMLNAPSEKIVSYFKNLLNTAALHLILKNISSKIETDEEMTDNERNLAISVLKFEYDCADIYADSLEASVDFSDPAAMSEALAEARVYDEYKNNLQHIIRKISNKETLTKNKLTLSFSLGDDFEKLRRKIAKHEELELFFSKMEKFTEESYIVLAKLGILYYIFFQCGSFVQIDEDKTKRFHIIEILKQSIGEPGIFFDLSKNSANLNSVNTVRKNLLLLHKGTDLNDERIFIPVDDIVVKKITRPDGFFFDVKKYLLKQVDDESWKDIIRANANNWAELRRLMNNPEIIANEDLQIILARFANVAEIFFELANFRAWMNKPKVALEILKNKVCPVKVAKRVVNSGIVPKATMKSLMKTRAVSGAIIQEIKRYFKRLGI